MSETPPKRDRSEMMEPHPPEVVGPPESEMCERCAIEPAEMRAKFWRPQIDGEPDEWDLFDFCGTCFLLWKADSDRTPSESYDFWGKYKDRRFDDEADPDGR